MEVLILLLVCSTPPLESISTVDVVRFPPSIHTHTCTHRSFPHPAPVHSLFGFPAHYLDLSKATDSILLFPIIGMDQGKLYFSKSSLLGSHVTLLLKEGWLQEEPSKRATWIARRSRRTPGGSCSYIMRWCQSTLWVLF